MAFLFYLWVEEEAAVSAEAAEDLEEALAVSAAEDQVAADLAAVGKKYQ